MTANPNANPNAGATDIDAGDLDVAGSEQRPETSEPDAYVDDPTIGGLGGADTQGGGAG